MSRRGIRVTAFEVKAVCMGVPLSVKEKLSFGWKVIINFELD